MTRSRPPARTLGTLWGAVTGCQNGSRNETRRACRLEYFKSKSEFSLIGICLSTHSCDIGTKESRMNSGSALPHATYYLTRMCTNDIVPRKPKGCCHQGVRGVVTNPDASPRRLLPIVIVATFCRQWRRAERKRLISMKSTNFEPGTPTPFSSTPSTGPQCLSRPSRSMVDLPPLVARNQSLLLTLQSLSSMPATSLSRPTQLFVHSRARRRLRPNTSRRIKRCSGWYHPCRYSQQRFRTATARCACTPNAKCRTRRLLWILTQPI